MDALKNALIWLGALVLILMTILYFLQALPILVVGLILAIAYAYNNWDRSK